MLFGNELIKDCYVCVCSTFVIESKESELLNVVFKNRIIILQSSWLIIFLTLSLTARLNTHTHIH